MIRSDGAPLPITVASVKLVFMVIFPYLQGRSAFRVVLATEGVACTMTCLCWIWMDFCQGGLDAVGPKTVSKLGGKCFSWFSQATPGVWVSWKSSAKIPAPPTSAPRPANKFPSQILQVPLKFLLLCYILVGLFFMLSL